MLHPALTVRGVDADFLLATVDDYAPSALEPHDDGVTLFFTDAVRRNGARDAVARAWPTAVITSREVDDEDWARRSQKDLQPVRVGRIVIVPAAEMAEMIVAPDLRVGPTSPSGPPAFRLVIPPSTGFGTGHHATTRLCLTALQALDLRGRVVLDVGTGSGVLAIAARALGARQALGIDDDPDAVRSAVENLSLNPAIDEVVMQVADLASGLPAADVIAANLTGALLQRAAGLLLGALRPGGHLIVSGLMRDERDDVVLAFAPSAVVWEGAEDNWVGLILLPRPS